MTTLIADVVQNVIEFIADRPSALLACRGVSWRWRDCTSDAVAFLNGKCATKLHSSEETADEHQRTHEACQVLCLSDRLEELHADTSMQLLRGLERCSALHCLTLRHVHDAPLNFSISELLRHCSKLNVASVTLCLDQAAITDEDMTDLQQMPSLKGLSLHRCVSTQVARAFLCPHLTFLDLSATPVVDDDLLGIAASGCASVLETLDLTFCEVSDPAALRRFTALTSLDLAISPVSDEVVSALTPTLRRLNLRGCRKITSSAAFSHLTALEELYIASTGIQDVAGFSSLPHLTSLNVDNCKKLVAAPCGRSCPALRKLSAMSVTWTSVDCLITISTLETLVLDDCDHITLTPLQHCGALRQLSVKIHPFGSDEATSPIDDSGILRLERVVTLEELVLGGCRRIRSVSFLASLPALTKLVLARTSVDDLGILGIELIPTLQTLDLSGTAVTNVTRLSSCRALTALDLSGTKITDDGMHGLEAIPTLTTLDARNCSHLRSVGSLGLYPALRELFLLECSITDEGVRGLERNQHLCHLDLRCNNVLRSVANLANGCRSLQVLYFDCTAVDDAGIAGLERLPSLRLLSLLDCPVTNPIPLLQSKSLTSMTVPMMEPAVMEQLDHLTREGPGSTGGVPKAFSMSTTAHGIHLARCAF
jgi:Leucine-rich repeat (LRR) protein